MTVNAKKTNTYTTQVSSITILTNVVQLYRTTVKFRIVQRKMEQPIFLVINSKNHTRSYPINYIVETEMRRREWGMMDEESNRLAVETERSTTNKMSS